MDFDHDKEHDDEAIEVSGDEADAAGEGEAEGEDEAEAEAEAEMENGEKDEQEPEDEDEDAVPKENEDDASPKTEESKGNWVDLIEKEDDRKMHIELRNIDKLIAPLQKGREIRYQAEKQRVFLFPIYPEDLAGEVLSGLLKKCPQAKVTFATSKDINGVPTVKGMVEMTFAMEQDAENSVKTLSAIRKDMQVHLGVRNDEALKKEYCSVLGTPDNADLNNKLTLFIPSLTESVSQTELWDLFPTAREIWVIPGKPRQHAYIKFLEEETLQAAIEKLKKRGPPRDGFNFCRLVRYYDVARVCKMHVPDKGGWGKWRGNRTGGRNTYTSRSSSSSSSSRPKPSKPEKPSDKKSETSTPDKEKEKEKEKEKPADKEKQAEPDKVKTEKPPSKEKPEIRPAAAREQDKSRDRARDKDRDRNRSRGRGRDQGHFGQDRRRRSRSPDGRQRGGRIRISPRRNQGPNIGGPGQRMTSILGPPPGPIPSLLNQQMPGPPMMPSSLEQAFTQLQPQAMNYHPPQPMSSANKPQSLEVLGSLLSTLGQLSETKRNPIESLAHALNRGRSGRDPGRGRDYEREHIPAKRLRTPSPAMDPKHQRHSSPTPMYDRDRYHGSPRRDEFDSNYRSPPRRDDFDSMGGRGMSDGYNRDYERSYNRSPSPLGPDNFSSNKPPLSDVEPVGRFSRQAVPYSASLSQPPAERNRLDKEYELMMDQLGQQGNKESNSYRQSFY